jgi:hypothetical protein
MRYNELWSKEIEEFIDETIKEGTEIKINPILKKKLRNLVTFFQEFRISNRNN